MNPKETTKLSVWIETSIREFVKSPENNLGMEELEPAWADPLLGFSRGDDPLFVQFKTDIGSFYWTPSEIFEKTFPGITINPSELTIISWILPQTDKIKKDNRKETTFPSERWARSRQFGEEFNVRLRDQVVALLTNAGYAALAPSNSSYFEIQTSDRFGAASTWSERHAAYVSGLGTFGLCDGLITPVGKAMRCGSVIARISIPPTKRLHNDHHAYCLFYSKGTCGKCIKRCPAGAITREGHNKEKCMEYVYTVTSPYVRAQFGFDSYGCGLCQTKVPCESKIPPALN
jgi:epoxyqueuosine reductase